MKTCDFSPFYVLRCASTPRWICYTQFDPFKCLRMRVSVLFKVNKTFISLHSFISSLYRWNSMWFLQVGWWFVAVMSLILMLCWIFIDENRTEVQGCMGFFKCFLKIQGLKINAKIFVFYYDENLSYVDKNWG